MEFHLAMFTLWCMTNQEMCQNHMNEISDGAMQQTNNYTIPFMIDLYKGIAPTGQMVNVLLSPISVVSLLGMASAGAQGDTDREINKVLGWNNLNEIAAHSGMSRTISTINSKSDGHNATILLGNSVFVQKGFKVLKKYVRALHKHYGVDEFLTVNFTDPSTRTKINKIIENATNGLIKDSIPPNVIGSHTCLVLCNVLYFQATWEKQFSEDFTTQSLFRLNKNDHIMADLMYQTGKFNYGYIEAINAEVVELKYKYIDTSMYILLPSLDGTDDDPAAALNNMKRQISQHNYIFGNIDNYLDMKTVLLTIPKFEMTTDYNLEEYLPGLGIEKVFDANLADLSGITGYNYGLHLSAMLHKSYIKVDEKGSVGAAVTSGVIASRNRKAKNFYANRPFAFFICDKTTNAILFFGQMANPNP